MSAASYRLVIQSFSQSSDCVPGGILARNPVRVHTQKRDQLPYFEDKVADPLTVLRSVEVGDQRLADIVRDGADFDAIVFVVDASDK